MTIKRGDYRSLIPDWICHPYMWPQAQTCCRNFTLTSAWCYDTLSLWWVWGDLQRNEPCTQCGQTCSIFSCLAALTSHDECSPQERERGPLLLMLSINSLALLQDSYLDHTALCCITAPIGVNKEQKDLSNPYVIYTVLRAVGFDSFLGNCEQEHNKMCLLPYYILYNN